MKYLLLLVYLHLSLILPAQTSVTTRIQTLLNQGAQQRGGHGDTSSKVDAALAAVDQAIALSDRYGLAKQSYQARVLKTEILFDAGRIREMEEMLVQARDSLKAEVARNISRHYNDGYFEAKDIDEAVRYAQLSLDISEELKDVVRQINAHNQLGFIYMGQDRIDEAEPHFLRVTQLGRHLKSDYAAYPYMFLIRINDRKGYLNRAIQYGLEGIRYLEFSGYRQFLAPTYQELARIYAMLGNEAKSLEFYEIARQEALRGNDNDLIWSTTRNTAEALVRAGRTADARRLLEKTSRDSPPLLETSKLSAWLACTRLHLKLGEYRRAEEYLQQCVQIRTGTVFNAAINRLFAETYFGSGQQERAKQAIEEVILRPGNWPAAAIAPAHQLAYRIDSARGDLASALHHLRISKQLTDSLNTVARLRQIEELTMQYETDKIRQDVQIKGQTIALLEQQQALQSAGFAESRLRFVIDSTERANHVLSLTAATARQDKDLAVQQRNIQQLESDNARRQASLEGARFTRNITLVVIALLGLVLLLLYKQFRSRQAASRIISGKNAALEELVRQKQSLLEEKDWLLKEVHHRVKNNLQTVVSLLESQAVYLNREALSANQDSRNRIYAMSLVHQKLYQSENAASIQLDIYFRELVEHLRDSLVTRRIRFDTSLLPAELDVSQAISLGLILNEAITNAIKHAFPPTIAEPVISIRLQEWTGGRLLLSIADNGIGLPEGLATARPSSLGLRLMKGLTGDIEGELVISGEQGTKVEICFIPKDPLPRIKEKQV